MADETPSILPFPTVANELDDPIVITGIGIGASLGSAREQVWQGVQSGRSGVRLTTDNDPVGPLRLPCGMVDWLPKNPSELKSIQLSKHVSAEALEDACLDWRKIDRSRFACSLSAQFGDIGYCYDDVDSRDSAPERSWWEQFLPCSATTLVANEFGLYGPRLCHTTACASGLISTITGARMLMADQADYALCGAADAITDIVLSAFNRMGVLSKGPDVATACRPFDKTRSGFVMGEGAAMLVLEKRSHATARGAKIYAEIAASQALCQAHHITGLDGEPETLEYLIEQLVRKSGWQDSGPQYLNAHGTGTQQNDRSELAGIRAALGDQADNLVISSNKAVLGHLINAAGSIELALTALAIRDNFAPPTMHLTQPEQIGQIDCLPEFGAAMKVDRALKLSLAFGGHLVGIALQRCPYTRWQRSSKPLSATARVRETAALHPPAVARAA